MTAFIRTLQKASSRYCRADLDIVLKPTKSMGSSRNPADGAIAAICLPERKNRRSGAGSVVTRASRETMKKAAFA
ncbi:hypothetical protein [Paraburkholderia ribeironis]|uniref:hypothetical protein n=1 Tax=Paraburkholderia ribeironis TaxID=1247936 RepID=UPI001177CDD1|nr:hypothetical protein [Paraburkholderia ribeironis]